MGQVWPPITYLPTPSPSYYNAPGFYSSEGVDGLPFCPPRETEGQTDPGQGRTGWPDISIQMPIHFVGTFS